MPDLSAPNPAPAQVESTQATLLQVQREMLERLTQAQWLLNPQVEPGVVWVHPPGPNRPQLSYVIHPADLTTCLAQVVQVDPPAST